MEKNDKTLQWIILQKKGLEDFENKKIGGINEALNYATKKVEQNVVVDYHTKHLQIRPKQLEPGPRQV